jgi:hypothetical protein
MGKARPVREHKLWLGGQDISNELQNNKIPVILSEPVHTPEVLARHAICEQMVQTGEENLQQ